MISIKTGTGNDPLSAQPALDAPDSADDPVAELAALLGGSDRAGEIPPTAPADLDPPTPPSDDDLTATGTTGHAGSPPAATLDSSPLPDNSPLFVNDADVPSAPTTPVTSDGGQSLDARAFFDAIRPSVFGGHLSQAQMSGMQAVLDAWTQSGMTDLRWLAYMFATMVRETGSTMQAIEEWGKGKGRPYGRPDPVTGETYYGRGLVQLTWKANYQKMGDLLGIDLVHHPELALDRDTAIHIMFEGMTRGKSGRGDFTGKSLEDYFNAHSTDWVNARRIINGTDHAQEIANNAQRFFKALQAAQV
jgi:hypothetical protein